jgi:hypothetical protein
MGVIGGWLDDTFAYPKRYDRYDFRGYCLVVIVGGDSPLKRILATFSYWHLICTTIGVR